MESGTDHARAPLLDGTTPQNMAASSESVCLFNLKTDFNETTNLAQDPKFADILESLLDRLKVHIPMPACCDTPRTAGSANTLPINASIATQAAADSGPPLDIAFAGSCFSTITGKIRLICSAGNGSKKAEKCSGSL